MGSLRQAACGLVFSICVGVSTLPSQVYASQEQPRFSVQCTNGSENSLDVSTDGNLGTINKGHIENSYTPSTRTAELFSGVYGKIYSGDCEGAIIDLDRFLDEERGTLKSYDLASILELRGELKMHFTDYDGAISDFEDALDTGGFRGDREMLEGREARLRSLLMRAKALKAEKESGKSE